MTTALFPGSFDPFTLGHLDIARRARRMFDRVVISVGVNPAKVADEREIEQCLDAIRRAVADIDGIDVMAWQGLTVDAAREAGATVMVRGVRSAVDYDYERSLAELNRRISGIDTVLLVASPEYSSISSSAVRELQRFGYDTTQFLP